MRLSKNSSKREVYSNTGVLQEIRKISNKQSNLPSKEIRKRTNTAQSQQKEGITNINIREEINKIGTKKKESKKKNPIMKPRVGFLKR